MTAWQGEARAARYVILGPTGWIGRATLDWLSARLGPEWRNQIACFGSRARNERGPDGADVAVADLKSLKPGDVDGSIVLHLAYLTKDKTTGMSDTDFFAANLNIDQTVIAALAQSKPRGVFVASSGAARDVATGVSRNLYGVTKLLQEDRFESYARSSGVPTFIGRIYNIAGPHINKLSLYAISSFAIQALKSKSIRIEATIPVFRSFLHVENLVEIVFAELLARAPPNSTADLCGAEVVEMKQIAAAVAEVLGLPVSAIQRGPIDFTRSSSYLGDPRATLVMAHKHDIELRSFKAQVQATVEAVKGLPLD